MKLKKYHYIAELINKFHILFMLCYILSIILMVFSSTYRIHGAVFIFATAVIDLFFKNDCPLTEEEAKYRKKAGDKIDKKGFVNGLLKRTLKLDFPPKIVDYLMYSASIVAFFIIVFRFL